VRHFRVDLELWGIKGLTNDTFSAYRGEIMRIPAPPLREKLRSKVKALNGDAIQEFEIGVSEHYSIFLFKFLIFTISRNPLVSRPRPRLDARIDWWGFDCHVGSV
jgi:hypothetical protein